MPWSEVTAMDERLQLVADVRGGTMQMRELRRRYGVSGKTGRATGSADTRSPPRRLLALSPRVAEEVGDGTWSVTFDPLVLGRFDERTLRITDAPRRPAVVGRARHERDGGAAVAGDRPQVDVHREGERSPRRVSRLAVSIDGPRAR